MTPSLPPADGLLLVDKPAGPTSHDAVTRVRRALLQRRVGHGGTLDPFATGLLVVAAGRATRLSRWLTGSQKTYEGEVRFGQATDTLDPTGRPVGEAVVPHVSRERLEAGLARLTGSLQQRPPMFSAKKVGGVALHRLARRGESVERATVTVRVERWDVLEAAPERLRFAVRCSAGTYVRVLAADLGDLVGCPAHLAALRRTASGPFLVRDAVPLDALSELTPDAARARLLRLDDLPDLLPACALADAAVGAFLHGRPVSAGDGPDGELFVRDRTGRLLGVGRREQDLLQPVVVLATPP